MFFKFLNLKTTHHKGHSSSLIFKFLGYNNTSLTSVICYYCLKTQKYESLINSTFRKIESLSTTISSQKEKSKIMPGKRLRQMNGKAFSSKGPEGELVRNVLTNKPKYISLGELKRPAIVTDKLMRDYLDFKGYDRESMKGGVRSILQTKEVKQEEKKLSAVVVATIAQS